MAMQYRTGKPPRKPGFDFPQKFNSAKSIGGRALEVTGELKGMEKSLPTPSNPNRRPAPSGVAYRMKPKHSKW